MVSSKICTSSYDRSRDILFTSKVNAQVHNSSGLYANGEWRGLHNEKLYTLYRKPNIVIIGSLSLED
jgi:hypothetical protein